MAHFSHLPAKQSRIRRFIRTGQAPSLTLYIGGGTPSELSCPQLKTLFLAVEKHFGNVCNFSESTFEANPESLTDDKIKLLKRFGISRLSLGLQSAQDHLLKKLGRRHGIGDFIRTFKSLRSNGFSNINVDVMTAIPGQTMKDLEETIAIICDMGAEHVSLYSLQVEEKTVFFKRGVKTDGDLAREMFDSACEKLTRCGFVHYEISNFAKPGSQSLHNLNYWNNGEYLGLGCGASSHIDGVRRTNPLKLDPYMKPLLHSRDCGFLIRDKDGRLPLLEGTEPAVSSYEKLSGKEKLGETILLGLRKLEGMTLSEEMKKEFGKQFQRLNEKGLIELNSGNVRLSKEGVYLGNMVFKEFVPPFD